MSDDGVRERLERRVPQARYWRERRVQFRDDAVGRGESDDGVVARYRGSPVTLGE
jgi:hypothetical protein